MANFLVLYGFLLALGGAEAFELAGLKGDLGALVLGVLIASHDKADELARTMLGFKDLFLLGFFVSIGVSGTADDGGGSHRRGGHAVRVLQVGSLPGSAGGVQAASPNIAVGVVEPDQLQ